MGERDHSDRTLEGARGLPYVTLEAIRRVRRDVKDPVGRAYILADICRVNALYMIMNAGSGHIGSSFSSLDLLTWLWTEELSNPNSGAPDSDTYFSSKGHDAPAFYSLLIALEKLDFDLIHRLRRLHGLPGHPDVATKFVAANTGSLGMGISKACGMARARRFGGRGGRIVVLTGDGELQEGQIWESLQPAANDKLGAITVIVDYNKYQSDAAVCVVSDLGAIEDKFRAFGWAVRRVNGHDLPDFRSTFHALAAIDDQPKVIIADTVKGCGVSFMEGVAAGDATYRFHAGSPSLADYLAAVAEMISRIDARLDAFDQRPLTRQGRSEGRVKKSNRRPFATGDWFGGPEGPPHEFGGAEGLHYELAEAPLPVRTIPSNPERLVVAYGEELLEIGRTRGDIVVLDADLVSDCGIEPFKVAMPDRFIECGIAEQHMVSLAGGLALAGMLPIVHSFACFLSARANEQIYNNATERTKIIYAATLAGIVPGGPGHSHQSVRDISAVGAVPGLIAIEPCSEREARLAIRWAVEENCSSTYLRFVNVPLDLPYSLSPSYSLQVGRGITLRPGSDAALVGYGPVLLANAWRAADELATAGVSAAVINLPWLNRIDDDWVRTVLARHPLVVTLDNHDVTLGQGQMIAAALARTGTRCELSSLGVSGIPVCGNNAEVLAHHRLDAPSIARVVLTARHVV